MYVQRERNSSASFSSMLSFKAAVKTDRRNHLQIYFEESIFGHTRTHAQTDEGKTTEKGETAARPCKCLQHIVFNTNPIDSGSKPRGVNHTSALPFRPTHCPLSPQSFNRPTTSQRRWSLARPRDRTHNITGGMERWVDSTLCSWTM